jgi:rubrerythrin
MHRSERFMPRRTRVDIYTQRAVESRRRGDSLQIRFHRHQYITQFQCPCGYTTTKAEWLEACPLCGRTFATGASARDAAGASPRYTTTNPKETT